METQTEASAEVAALKARVAELAEDSNRLYQALANSWPGATGRRYLGVRAIEDALAAIRAHNELIGYDPLA